MWTQSLQLVNGQLAGYLPRQCAGQRGPGGWFLALGTLPNAAQPSRASPAGKAPPRARGLGDTLTRGPARELLPRRSRAAPPRPAAPPPASSAHHHHPASTDRQTLLTLLARRRLFRKGFTFPKSFQRRSNAHTNFKV